MANSISVSNLKNRLFTMNIKPKGHDKPNIHFAIDLLYSAEIRINLVENSHLKRKINKPERAIVEIIQ